MGRRINHLKARWSEAGMLIIGTVCIFATPTICSFFFEQSTTAIKFSGLGLQLFGLGIVIKQIIEVRKGLELPSMWANVKQWFKDALYIFKGPEVRSLRMGLETGRYQLNGKPTYEWVTHTPNPSDPPQQQIDTVMKNFEEMHNKLAEIYRTKEQAIKDLKREVRKALAEGKSDHVSLEETVAKVLAGNHTNEIIGVLLIMVGIVYSTFPKWIAEFWWFPLFGY